MSYVRQAHPQCSHISHWTTKDVADFVTNSGYSRYANHFRQFFINGERLERMCIMDLQRIGITHMTDALTLHTIISHNIAHGVCRPNEAPRATAVPRFTPPVSSQWHRVQQQHQLPLVVAAPRYDPGSQVMLLQCPSQRSPPLPAIYSSQPPWFP